MINQYVICLLPEDKLKKKILELKKYILKTLGPQEYLKDDPHLTLYFGNFELESIKKEVGLITNRLNKIKIVINGLYVFKEDPITKKSTAVYKFDTDTSNRLKMLQAFVIGCCNKYRKGMPERYIIQYDTLTKMMKKNIDTCGFPFVGNIWVPHITLASIEKDLLKGVKKKLKEACPIGNWAFNQFTLYKLSKNEKMYLIKKYNLK